MLRQGPRGREESKAAGSQVDLADEGSPRGSVVDEMNVDTFACDICFVQKKTANRWWKVYPVKGGVVILEWDSELQGVTATDTPAHLCGENHVFEWVSKHLTQP